MVASNPTLVAALERTEPVNSFKRAQAGDALSKLGAQLKLDIEQAVGNLHRSLKASNQEAQMNFRTEVDAAFKCHSVGVDIIKREFGVSSVNG